MKKLLIGLLLGLMPVMVLADAEDVANYFKKHGKEPVLQDIFKKQAFIPPYENFGAFLDVVHVCNDDFLDEEPFYKQYAIMGAKEDLLAYVSGELESFIGGFIKNSGGVTAIYDYISGDFVYLSNVRNRPQAKAAAITIFNEYHNSPQMQKLLNSDAAVKLMANKKDKSEVSLKMKIALQCGLSNLIYTMLGGVEDSIHLQSISGIKNQIHSKTMGAAMSQTQEAIRQIQKYAADPK